MILVGLTGGIGSGKSTVSALLAERGAVIVDADLLVRQVQQPGQPVLAAIVERFGDVLAPDGTLDRARLASIVFTDAEALKALNGIVHPAVRAETARLVAEQRDTDRVVVLDVPLLVESGRYQVGAVVVVDVPVDVAVERLIMYRNFDEADARARIGRQVDAGAAPRRRRPGHRQLGRPGVTGAAGGRAVGLDADAAAGPARARRRGSGGPRARRRRGPTGGGVLNPRPSSGRRFGRRERCTNRRSGG